MSFAEFAGKVFLVILQQALEDWEDYDPPRRWDGSWMPMPKWRPKPPNPSLDSTQAGSLMIEEYEPVTWETPHMCAGTMLFGDEALEYGNGKTSLDDLKAIISSHRSKRYRVGFVVPKDFRGYELTIRFALEVICGRVRVAVEQDRKFLSESELISEVPKDEPLALTADVPREGDNYYGVISLEPGTKVVFRGALLQRNRPL